MYPHRCIEHFNMTNMLKDCGENEASIAISRHMSGSYGKMAKSLRSQVSPSPGAAASQLWDRQVAFPP